MRTTRRVILICAAVIVSGCAPKVTVIPLSEEVKKEKGAIPYYLPRPYLLVTKNFDGTTTTTKKTKEVKEGEKEKTTTTTESTTIAPADPLKSDRYSIRVIYLPDLKRKYGLKITDGIGSFESTISLVDGWKLTGVNVKSDSKTAETIASVGSAVKDIVSAAGLPPEMAQALISELREEVKKPNAQFWLFELTDDLEWKCAYCWPDSICEPDR